MNIKKTIALIAASAAGLNIASAQELSITSDVSWESAYVFRGEQLAKSYFAPSVDISYGDFYFGIWAALPAHHIYDNEVDFYAGYGVAVSDFISADVGFTYYTFPDAQSKFFDSTVNSLEIYAGLSFEAPFSPSVYVFHDIDLDTFTFEVAGGHSIPVADSSSFDIDVYAGHVAVSGAGNFLYYGVSGAYVHSFNDVASASVSLNWGGSDERGMFNNKKNKLWFGVGFSAGF